jgi:hypothetical protein
VISKTTVERLAHGPIPHICLGRRQFIDIRIACVPCIFYKSWTRDIAIMSLYRWSLPTRGLRDTSHEEGSSGRPKFPTIHIGQPNQRQRPNLSTSFAILFEKPENRRDGTNSESHGLVAADLPTLAPRPENLLPPVKDNTGAIHLVKGKLMSASKDAEVGVTQPVRPLQSKSSNKSVLPRIETPKIRSFSLSSSETNETGKQDGYPLLEPIKSTDTQELDEIRPVLSSSSSYPSEGMRSPIGNYQSPRFHGDTDKSIREYRLLGEQPSRLNTTATDVTVDNLGPLENVAVVTDDKPTSSTAAIASNCAKFRVALLRDTVQGSIHQDFSVGSRKTRGWPALSTFQEGRKRHHPSSTSDVTVPILKNEGSITSELEVSFVTYSRRRFRSVSEDCFRYKGDKTASAYRLLPPTATEGTCTTARRHITSSDRVDTRPVRRDSVAKEKPERQPSSWMQLFTLPSLNSPSADPNQRIHKFNLVEWVKGVYVRTRSRFELVAKSGPMPVCGNTSPARPLLIQRQKKRKILRVKKWKASKAICKAAKRSRPQKKTAAPAAGFLSTRKSLQLNLGRPETVDHNANLHRSQSCPAEVGFQAAWCSAEAIDHQFP